MTTTITTKTLPLGYQLRDQAVARFQAMGLSPTVRNNGGWVMVGLGGDAELLISNSGTAMHCHADLSDLPGWELGGPGKVVSKTVKGAGIDLGKVVDACATRLIGASRRATATPVRTVAAATPTATPAPADASLQALMAKVESLASEVASLKARNEELEFEAQLHAESAALPAE